MIEYPIALIVCALVALGVGAIVRRRGRNSSFGQIHFHVTLVIFILLISFYTFAILGLNIWSISIIPVVSLVLVFLIIRNAVAKVLDTH